MSVKKQGAKYFKIHKYSARHLMHPPRLNRILPYSGLLSGVRWLETDVFGVHIVPILKGTAGQTDVSELPTDPIFLTL